MFYFVMAIIILGGIGKFVQIIQEEKAKGTSNGAIILALCLVAGVFLWISTPSKPEKNYTKDTQNKSSTKYIATQYVTDSGYFFTRTKDQLKEAYKYAGDRKAFDKYLQTLIDTNNGGVLQEGLIVHITDSTIDLVEIRVSGELQTFWTLRDAIKELK